MVLRDLIFRSLWGFGEAVGWGLGIPVCPCSGVETSAGAALLHNPIFVVRCASSTCWGLESIWGYTGFGVSTHQALTVPGIRQNGVELHIRNERNLHAMAACQYVRSFSLRGYSSDPDMGCQCVSRVSLENLCRVHFEELSCDPIDMSSFQGTRSSQSFDAI